MIALSLSLPDLAPFFEERHAVLAEKLRGKWLDPLALMRDEPAVLARAMAKLGLYAHLVPEGGGRVDVRALVLIREALAHLAPAADAIFAVQGLGAHPLVLAGSDAQLALAAGLARGERIAGFALTEPEAGSDVAALVTTARADGDGWVIDGEKTLISNVGIADAFVVFAKTDPAAGRKGISAFWVDASAPGLTATPIPLSVPHPIGKLRFERCRVSADALVGKPGEGFSLAMRTLDAFRITVGAAANGMAARALALSIEHVRDRRQFGGPLSDLPTVRATLADMATELDAARLLVARAAHLRDANEADRASVGKAAAMAKMYATEAAQRVVDQAVQLHGGMGVVLGSEVEALYREVRPLRIYEGATEVQRHVIAKAILG